MKYVPLGSIDKMAQMMARRRIGNKPLSEAMSVYFADA